MLQQNPKILPHISIGSSEAPIDRVAIGRLWTRSLKRRKMQMKSMSSACQQPEASVSWASRPSQLPSQSCHEKSLKIESWFTDPRSVYKPARAQRGAGANSAEQRICRMAGKIGLGHRLPCPWWWWKWGWFCGSNHQVTHSATCAMPWDSG